MINTGIILMIIVAFMQSIIGTLVKIVSSNITIGVQLFAYYGTPLLLFIYFFYKNGFQAYKTKFIWLHFIRGIFTTIAVLCFFYANIHLGLGVAAVLFNSVPVFIPIFAFFILKEKASKCIILSIIISLIGVIIIINPSIKSFINPISFIGLTSGIFMALSQVILKLLANKGESSTNIVFYLYFMGSLISAIFIMLEGLITKNNSLNIINFSHNSYVLLILLCLGLVSLIAQRILTKAFYYMEAIKLAPFLYLSIPISSLIGFLFWKQTITVNFVSGTSLILIGIFTIIYVQIKQNNL